MVPGSGQSWEGYAASKLYKAGFRSNNIDPNARHCMASAVGGLMRTFGIDEPMGCYDDFEHADAFVLRGSNMCEVHPILWTRLTGRRLGAPHVKVAVLSTFEHRSFDLADIPMVFTPQTDMVILNYIANHIIQTGKANKEFVQKHTNFRIGNTDIGYGLRPEHPIRKAAKNVSKAGGSKEASFEEFAEFVSSYTLDKAHEMSGVPKVHLEALAELYVNPKTKVMSLWTMGVNQHTRGVWTNNLIYNIHLLTGKISEPGNSPFSLTGQPSACGTAREVGTFAHRLPADMVVRNPKHRALAEKLWKLPKSTIPPKPGYHAVLQNRMLKDGKLNAYWVQVNNNMQAAPNMMEEALPGYRNPENFIVVSDAYPTVTAQAADLILPAAMWVERKVPTEMPNDAPSSGINSLMLLVSPSRTSGKRLNFQSASRLMKCGLQSCSTRTLSTKARPFITSCSPTARSTSFRCRTWTRATKTRKPDTSDFTCKRGCSRNMPFLDAGRRTILPTSTPITKDAVCAGLWSMGRTPNGASARDPILMPSRIVVSTSTANRTAEPLSLHCLTNRLPKVQTRIFRSGCLPDGSWNIGTPVQ